jgi:hypothetical protein
MVDPNGIVTLAPNGKVITLPCVCCPDVSTVGGTVILPGILGVQCGVEVVVSGITFAEVVASGKRLSPTCGG